MIIRIERLGTEAEHDKIKLEYAGFKTMEEAREYMEEHGITFAETEKEKEEDLFWNVAPPKLRVRESLMTKNLNVDETVFNEILAVLKEYNVPYETIENGIKITYLSNEGLAYLGFYVDENGEVKEFDD